MAHRVHSLTDANFWRA